MQNDWPKKKGLSKASSKVFAQGVSNRVRQLRRLFGPLAEDDLAAIKALSIAQLDRLSEDLLDFTQPADLAQWLQQLPKGEEIECE